MALASHDRIIRKSRTGHKALVLESRAGACSVLVRALESEGASVELVRTPEEVGSQWNHHDILVLDVAGKDETLRQLVKWARQTGDEPYVVAVGDGEHDPAWLTGGRRGAHASMAEPDAQSARLILADARGWLAAREVTRPPSPAAPGASLLEPAPRAALPNWLPPLMDKATAAMAVFDTQLRYRLCNRAWRELFGLHETEVNGRSHFDVFPQLGSAWKEAYQRALGGETLTREEEQVLTSSGASLPLRWEISPWRDSAGQIGGVLAVFEKRPIPRSGGSQHFETGLGRSVLHASGAWLVVQDPQGIILGSSKGFSGALGRQGRMFGRSYWDAARVLETDFPEIDFRQSVSNWRAGGGLTLPPKTVEILQGADGTRYRIEWSLFPYFPDTGDAAHGIARVGVPHIVKEEILSTPSPAPAKRAETESAPSELVLRLAAAEAEKTMLRERLDQLVRALGEARELAPRAESPPDDWKEIGTHLPLAVLVLDAKGDILAANDALESLIGQSYESGVSFERWLAEKALAPKDEIDRWRSLGWRKQVPCVLRVAGCGGVEKSIELQSRLIGDGRMLVLARDVTDETRTAEMLRASETKFRGFFHDAALAMVVVNGLGEIVDTNEALATLVGRKRREMLGAGLESLLEGGWAAARDLEPGHSAILVTTDGKSVRVARLDRPAENVAANAMFVMENAGSATAPVFGPYFQPPATALESRRIGALRHRVNNDLQVLATLCAIDAGTPGPRTASLQRRLQVASLAYGATLHAADVGETVDASAFLERIASLVSRETGLEPEAIHRSLSTVPLPASKFMMLGLATRELLDNALRHGHGLVSLNSGTLGNTAWVEVLDHGPGVENGFSLHRDAGLGLRIVEMACEELGGRLTWSCQPSTCFRMVIPVTPGGSNGTLE